MTLYAARNTHPIVEATHWIIEPDGRWFAVGIDECMTASLDPIVADSVRELADRPEEGVLVWREASGEIAEIQWPTKTLAFELFRYQG